MLHGRGQRRNRGHGRAEVDRTETDLRVILDCVDGWLRFAEVRNSGVIALSAMVCTALLAAVPAVQHDLAAQVTVNSRITVRQLHLFERGGLLALAGSLFHAAAMIARLFGY